MNIRTVLLLSFAALFSSLGLTVLAAPPGGHLNISQVLVDDPNDPTSITIVGTDFLFGPEAPIVTLGEYVDPLEIVGVPTNETIVALLPENIVAGDYLLTVITGTGQSQNDEYDLTIGAVGPRGPKGDPGNDGQDGADGTNGQDGAPGANGANGQDGTSCTVTPGDGFATISCDDGTAATVNDGADGEQGPEGPQGEPGPPGSVSDTYFLEASVILTTGGNGYIYVMCDPGDAVVSGGRSNPGYVSISVFEAQQISRNAESREAWFFRASNSSTSVGIRLQAGCIDRNPGSPTRLFSQPVSCALEAGAVYYCND